MSVADEPDGPEAADPVAADAGDEEREGTGGPPSRTRWRPRRPHVVAAVGVVVAAAVGTGVLLAEQSGGAGAGAGYDAGAVPAAPRIDAGVPAGSGSAGPSAVGSRRAFIGPRVGASVARPPSPTRDAGVNVTVTGDIRKDHHELRVFTARSDLSGTHELAWAADSGQRVGDARCTQNFRLGGPPRVRQTMLLCWRTSAHRSVYAIDVDLDHKPSGSDTVNAIDHAWAKLG